MIVPVLALGGGRYLTAGGDVAAALRTYTPEQVEAQRHFTPDFDPELAGMSGATYLREDERQYWEECARRGGHTLDDLLAVDLDA